MLSIAGAPPLRARHTWPPWGDAAARRTDCRSNSDLMHWTLPSASPNRGQLSGASTFIHPRAAANSATGRRGA